MQRGLYGQSNRNVAIRYFKNHKIAAKVSKIDFLFKECRRTGTVVRLIYVTLRPHDQNLYGTIIHVKYHHIDGVDDFIVLREHYDKGTAYHWEVGERFMSAMDDTFRLGTVIGLNSANYCHLSLFHRYHIRWDSNNRLKELSPWDMQPIFNPKHVTSDADVLITDSDRSRFFTRRPEEWPDFNEEKELKRLSKG
jgi:hypothetical protein